MLRPNEIEYTVQIWQEGDNFIAHAMPLDVMSSGPDPGSARAAVAEAVEVFLMTAKDMGSLEEILCECGYGRDDEAWKSPGWVSIERRLAAVGA